MCRSDGEPGATSGRSRTWGSGQGRWWATSPGPEAAPCRLRGGLWAGWPGRGWLPGCTALPQAFSHSLQEAAKGAWLFPDQLILPCRRSQSPAPGAGSEAERSQGRRGRWGLPLSLHREAGWCRRRTKLGVGGPGEHPAAGTSRPGPAPLAPPRPCAGSGRVSVECPPHTPHPHPTPDTLRLWQ